MYNHNILFRVSSRQIELIEVKKNIVYIGTRLRYFIVAMYNNFVKYMYW